APSSPRCTGRAVSRWPRSARPCSVRARPRKWPKRCCSWPPMPPRTSRGRTSWCQEGSEAIWRRLTMRVNGRGLGWGLLLVVGLLAPAWQAGAAQAAGPGERLARLDAGVRAAEAVRAVKRLQNSHAHFIDAGLWAEAAALFTADGTFESGGKVVRGQQALRRHFMQQAGRGSQGLDEGQLHTHLLMQPIITLGADGRTAKGTWHELSMRGRFGRHATWAGGIYENEYVLEQGTWKISRM